jgi:mannose-1-phosphate guanylyltransferase
MLYQLILAGGSGTRFWPMSRAKVPKQFLALAGEKSLIRETFERLEPLVGARRVWVVSGEAHVDLVRAEIPEIPRENILGEPVARNTAPCIGLAARCILERDADASLLVSPSDHIVRPPEAFRALVLAAARFLEDSSDASAAEPWTATFGILPRYPATGFGYIERGESLPGGDHVFRVARFKEKPPIDRAREFVESGRFYWNSGIFLWKAGGISRLIEKHMPQLSSGLDEIGLRSRSEGGLGGALRAGFGALPSISIDYGVLELQKNVAVLVADFEWDDVGAWRAVEAYAPRDEAGNSVVGRHLAIDSRGCILVGKKRLIAVVGVKDLVVVETDDAVLVCPRDQTERVKEVVERLRAENRTDLL